MGLLSTVVGAVTTGGASLWAKAAPYLLAGGAVIGVGIYIFVLRSELAAATAQVALYKQQAATAEAANKVDLVTISKDQAQMASDAKVVTAVQQAENAAETTRAKMAAAIASEVACTPPAGATAAPPPASPPSISDKETSDGLDAIMDQAGESP